MSSPSKHLPFPEFVKSQERRLSSADVIVANSHGEVLVVKNSYLPHWSFPGGIVDAGESPSEAAVRELYEETSLDLRVEDIRFSAIIHRRVSGVDIYGFVFQLAEPLDSLQAITIDNHEIIATDWVSKADVNNQERGRYNRAVRNWASNQPQIYIDHADEVAA